MLTLGIDLAAQPRETAACTILWEAGRAVVKDPYSKMDDELAVREILAADKTGIDVPLGWPEPFVEWLVAHHAGNPLPKYSSEQLRLRATDAFVRGALKTRGIKRTPLSVSSDHIAITAWRAAGLLSRLSGDRIGTGRICEVYPAAALDVWGLRSSKYKGKEEEHVRNREELMMKLVQTTGKWLHIPSNVRELCVSNDNVLDALIAALVARAKAGGLCESVPQEVEDRAAREGWIALPKKGSLDLLPTAPNQS